MYDYGQFYSEVFDMVALSLRARIDLSRRHAAVCLMSITVDFEDVMSLAEVNGGLQALQHGHSHSKFLPNGPDASLGLVESTHSCSSFICRLFLTSETLITLLSSTK